MQKKYSGKLLSCFLCISLMIMTLMSVSACGNKTESGAASAAGQETENAAQMSDVGQETANSAQIEIRGEGETVFFFTVVDEEGGETQFEIHTDKETVGEALLELGLIAGEESEYGLYVKTVNGITADYDTDGVYWAFYINGEYAVTGVDSTAVTEGETYAFKVE
ncbi:MAG: DUF4430 domain-containing protein [Bacillus sp. (in: Bacteria)]|nr:DUF4430 domain-containing protein [Bacillus sp. (in: firmicutes)]MCM1427775.1 DUF4430 domain-containing protein [Eubacterium sp.]